MPEKDLRIGVIGVGMMGADHAERVVNRVAGARLVAVSRPRHRAGCRPGRRLRRGAQRRGPPRPHRRPRGGRRRHRLARVRPRGAGAGLPRARQVRPVREAADHGQRVVAAPGRGRGQGRPPAGPGGLHAPLRPRVRADEVHARQRAARPHAAAAQHPPQQDRPGLVPLRDDRARLAGARGRRRAVHLRRGDHRDHRAGAGTPTGVAAEGVLDPQVSLFRMAGGGLVTSEVFVNCQVGYEVRCEAVAERGTAHRGQEQHRHLLHGGRRATAATGAVRCHRTSGSASPAPTTSRSRPGSTPSRRGEVVGPTSLGRVRRDGRVHGRHGVARHRPAREGRPRRPTRRCCGGVG